MQGGRVKRNSPYWQVYTDCGTVLRRSRHLQQQQRQPGHQGGGAGAAASHLLRLSLRQSLTGIAGTVARAANARPPAKLSSDGRGGAAGTDAPPGAAH